MSAKKTSGKRVVASKVSKVLRDGRTSATSKSVAGSALSQREKSSKREIKGTTGTGPRNSWDEKKDKSDE